MRPNLATLIDDFHRHGNATAIVTYRGNRRVAARYKDLAMLAELFASELTRRNIQKGDRVILWGQNGAEWVGAFFGCVLRGVLVVPLDAAGSPDFARRVIAETSPRLIIADHALMGEFSDQVPQLAFEDVAALPPIESNVAQSEPAVDLDTPLQILFTSGTTSEPKGVVHTHRNVLASVAPIEKEIQKYLRYERFVHPLRFLHTLPLSHVFGQFMGLWLPVLLAAEVHFESRLQAQRLIEIIGHERISVLAAVPRVLDLLRSQLLLAYPNLKEEIQKAQGESVWRRWWRFRKIHRLLGFKFWAFVCGGASLPAELESFWNTLGFALIQGYGMTETTALITLNHPFKIGKGTIGKPLPGREIRIGDDGEILVRGDMVSTSTWQQGQMVQSSDPWLATGDLARSDDAGQFQFLGRKSQVIVTSSGLNIHPEDVEVVLNEQPGVRAAVVVAASMPGGTESMAVLLFRGTNDEAAKTVQAANSRLADYQRIRNWRLWPGLDFPRTSTGKIQRGKVAQWANAHIANENRTASGGEHDPLVELIARITRTAATATTENARLDEDLHLDSLGRVQLQSELEQRFGVALDDATLANLRTLGELRQQVGLSNQATATAVETVLLESVITQTRQQEKHIYPKWPWSLPALALRLCFIECIMMPLVWILAKPRVIREINAVETQRAMLIIANHVTSYDGALVLYALPGHIRRRVAIAMAANMLDEFRHARGQSSWWRNMLAPAAYLLITALFNVFPLPRSAGFRHSFAHMGAALDRGYNILIFPEGHRSEGTLQRFRSGIGLLVQESNALVLPVTVQGLGELKRERRWFRSGKLSIRVGTPLQIDSRLPADEITILLERTLQSMMR